MKKLLTFFTVVALTLSCIFAQTIIGYTSFEEPAIGGKYYDTGDAATDHPLVNNDGEASVNYDPGETGQELGFSAYYTNTLDDVGLTDGDYIGVTDFTPSTEIGFSEGNQGYQLSDCDGLVTVTLDTVYLSDASAPQMSLFYFIKDDGWETNDFVRIWVETNSGEIELLNTDGSDIDDLGIEGTWNNLSSDLTGYSWAILNFELQSNAGYEALYLDFIQFTDGEINFPPTADAGPDQSVNINSKVTLSGTSSSDADGTIETFLWEQTAGETVTLSSASDATVTFTAPPTSQELSFTLTVTDDDGDSDIDTVNISVSNVGASSIFFSEYVEGATGNNKYLEIFNGSESSVDLAAEGYSLAATHNGDGDFTYAVFSDWGTVGTIPAGEVIVIASDGHDFYPTPDLVLLYPSPVHFNGNDAVALMKNNVVVDLIGDPTSSENIIADITLRRISSVEEGNPVFTLSEWAEYPANDVSGLGSHNANADAPIVTEITVSPDFIDMNTEVEISAVITSENSTIASVIVKYGTDGNLINECDVTWEDDPQQHLWKALLSSMEGNSKIDFIIVATDDNGNTGESPTSSFLVAGSNYTPISDIHTNAETMGGQLVTIKGIMTIGAGVLRNDRTSAYIQDESGRGLNVYNSDLVDGMDLGDEVIVVGFVEKYFSTVEVKDFNFKTQSTGNEIPVAQEVTVPGANSSDWEGTLIKFQGTVAEKISITGGVKIKINEGTDTTIVMVWDATGIDTESLTIGEAYSFQGVGSQYYDDYQLLVGYPEDIRTPNAIHNDAVKVDNFKLNPAYPNPFNPTTTISWQLAKDSQYQVYLFNMLGQKVKIVEEGFGKRGTYSQILNARDLTSGVYFIRLNTNNQVFTQKIILMK